MTTVVRMEHRLIAVMFTDIKGFTNRASATPREDLIAMLEKHKSVLSTVVEARGGTLVKQIGDGFLVMFSSPTNAILAASISIARSRPRRRSKFAPLVPRRHAEKKPESGWGSPVNDRIQGDGQLRIFC